MSSLAQRRGARSALSEGRTIAALDIGSSKVTCLVGQIDSQSGPGFRLIGGGHQQSRGFSGGAITDMEALERAIRLAVEDAERQAGQRIDAVRMGITGPRLTSHLLTAQVGVSASEISQRDVRRVQALAMSKLDAKSGQVLCAYPVAYRVDGQDGVREPVGMIADSVGILLHVVCAPAALVRNLTECVSRAHLKVERIVPSAIASGYGTLIEDERDNGAVCVDMGASVTAVSVFMNGSPAALFLVPAGGGHVTADLAQGLGTTFAAAERIKTVHGQADPQATGLAERIECPKLGDNGRLNAVRLPRQTLVDIINPRIEEIFELISRNLAASDLAKVMPRRSVLTGAASLLPGVREVAGRHLIGPVRLGRPVDAEILGETLGSPGFSTAAGLLTYGLKGEPEAAWAGTAQAKQGVNGAGKRVNKTWNWLKENF